MQNQRIAEFYIVPTEWGFFDMILRNYRPSDCAEILTLFYETVHSVNSKDYNSAQLDAWADGNAHPEIWNQSLSDHKTVVMEDSGKIVGFGDMDNTGYLDRLYVHRDYQRRGIASAICDVLEKNQEKVLTHASITAKPFFLSRGYQVVKAQEVTRHGVILKNYVMERTCLHQSRFPLL